MESLYALLIWRHGIPSGSAGRASATQRRASINQPTPVPYAPKNPQDNEDARQNLQDSEDVQQNLEDSEDEHRNLQDSEEARRNLPDTEDASEEIPTFHRHGPASARRKRLRKRSEIDASTEASPVQVFPEAGLQAFRVLRRESTSRQEPPIEMFQQNQPGASTILDLLHRLEGVCVFRCLLCHPVTHCLVSDVHPTEVERCLGVPLNDSNFKWA